MTVVTGSKFDQQTSAVIEVVTSRVISFMNSELSLDHPEISRAVGQNFQAELRDVTAIVGVGSMSGLYIACSYDDALIREIMERYTSDIEIEPDEVELYVEETASDIVNVIVGNCTAEFAQRGETVLLTPPTLITGAKTIRGRPETTVFSVNLRYPAGTLSLVFVGPKLMFDETLEFTGEAV